MNPELQALLTELKSAVPTMSAKFEAQFKNVQERIDAIEQKASGFYSSSGDGENIIHKALQGSEDLQALMGGRRKSAIIKISNVGLDLKTTITSTTLGSATSGVLVAERLNTVATLAQRRNFMRDILPKLPTEASAVDFVKETSFTNAASPQVEASAKSESALDVETEVAPVRTIAHWIPASKQALDDYKALFMIIQRKLIYGYLLEEDRQIIYGDGTGQNLSGLATEATAFDTGLLIGADGWERADLLRRAVQQAERTDEAALGWFAIHPDDWANIELTKDDNGNYIAGNPRTMLPPSLWSRPVAVTTAMASGQFLAGSGDAADLRIRQEITIEISTEHSDFFTRNLIAIRCEGRVALPIYRPGGLILGSFTTSPI